MKIQLILVGKTTKKYLSEGIKEYQKRLERYNPFEVITIPEIKKNANLSTETIKQLEGEKIEKKLPTQAYIILLDEHGKNFTSVKFAHFLQDKFLNIPHPMIFIIGGAYGFSDNIYKRAHMKLSLSSMTFSHQLVRIIFLEQLYRAFTILKGEPYHHE